jgi:endonuclease/exonuclease/phosphatase family metal-dependent hydrolase
VIKNNVTVHSKKIITFLKMTKRENRNKKLSFISRILLLINYFFAICLLISYTASYISPATLWIIAFFGLVYPFLLIINIIFVILWLLRLKKYLFISLISIFIGWNHITNYIQFNNKQKPVSNNDVKILSYNVRSFGLYNYNKDWSYNFERKDSIFKFIKKQSSDIICFQEFVYDKTGGFKTLDTIIKFQKAVNYHTEYTKSSKNINYFGLATFSYYPIINKGKILFNTNSCNSCIFSDIKINDDTIRVYNVHFESVHLGHQDYKFAEDMSNIKNITNKKEVKTCSKRILSLLKIAFIKRASQAELVARHIKASPYPVIICGDFNDVPYSYSYHTASKGLLDAFVQSGKNFGQTYLGTFPSFRIDYILYNKKFTSYNFKTYHIKFSDHYPVSCYFKL